MKKVALIIAVLWLLLAGGVWAADTGYKGYELKKDCDQEVKVEVGGRYLIEETKLSFGTYLGPPSTYVTSLTIKEISKSGRHALVLKLNEEKPSWVVIKDLKIIERLPEGGWKASSVELGSNTLELKPTPGPWQDMKGR